MLLGRGNSNNRGRGQSTSRGRGSRGRGTTASRGAHSSRKNTSLSSTPILAHQVSKRVPASPKALQDKSNHHGSSRGGYKGRPAKYNLDFHSKKKAYLSSQIGKELTAANSTNAFDSERLENAAKREQRGQASSMANGRGGMSRGRNKQVRFQDLSEAESSSSSERASPVDGFLRSANATFGSSTTKTSPFGSAPSTANNPFSSASSTTTNPFGKPSSMLTQSAPSNPFAQTTSAQPFGQSTTSVHSNPFQAPLKGPSISKPSPFGSPSSSPSIFGAPSAFIPSKPEVASSSKSSFTKQIPQSMAPVNDSETQQLLKSRGILPPTWPQDPGNPKQRSAMETLYHAHKGYQAKARTFLMQQGKLDDPDKPKLLSEAISFKGTCEEMCPEFERITRIVEHDVPNAEKEDAPDGTRWPAPHKMIKALARSAAGQDAPLPEEVRTPAALRRTFDYLIHEVLGDDGNLRKEHGYIWNRTRAIRRDFVFQEASMNSADLHHMVYCLEGITRFHVVALHQMSKLSEDGVAPEDFSEQQEVEQLGKALLSLVQTYDDCKERGINCENEAEFRAYYVLINSRNPAVLEQVQDWGLKFWKSEEIRIALVLAETLQNIWDARGPLKPHSATEVAWNAYSRFFSILQETSVSYTMACFAEIFFNEVRKAALKTILEAYRKQRDQTKDWTLSNLNAFLEFDDEADIIPFAEAYGLRFEEVDDQFYLSFDSSDEISDPFPPLKQPHSEYLVEYKRGDHTLPEVIDTTVYYDIEADEMNDDGETNDTEGEEEMFVGESDQAEISALLAGKESGDKMFPFEPVATQDPPAGDSLFGRISAPSGKSLPPSIPEAASKPGQSPFSSVFGTVSAPQQQPNILSSASMFESKPGIKSFSDIFGKPTSPAPSQSEVSPLFSQKPSTKTPIDAQESTPSPTLTNLKTPSIFTSTPATTPLGNSSNGQNGQAPGIFGAPQGTPIIGDTATNEISAPPMFGSHQVEAPAANTPPVPLSTSKVEAPASSQSPQPLATLGKYPVEMPMSNGTSQTSPFFGNHSIGAPQKATTPLPTTQPGHNALQNGVLISSKRESLPSSPTASQSSVSQPFKPQPPGSPSRAVVLAPSSAKVGMDNFSQWVVNGPDGIIDQFKEFFIANLLKQTFDTFKKEEKARRMKEAADEARKEADSFRYTCLANKYFQKWRQNAHLLWMKRQGRRNRKLRQEMAEASFRKSQASKGIVDEFRATIGKKRRSMDFEDTDVDVHPNKKRSMDIENIDRFTSSKRRSVEVDGADMNPSASKKRRSSLESLLHATGVLDGVRDVDNQLRRIVREDIPAPGNKQHKSSRSTNSPNSSTSNIRHRQVSSTSSTSSKFRDDPLRRSLLSDSSYLSGGSRLHLLKDYSISDERRRQISGVQTDYFRLKARGITTLPNGTALASSVAKDVLHRKRSFDGSSKPTTPRISKQLPAPRSVPPKFDRQADPPRPIGKPSDEDMQAVARAKAMMAEHKKNELKKKMSKEFEQDFGGDQTAADEALFARTRRLKEVHKEDEEWFKEMNGRLSRSAS